MTVVLAELVAVANLAPAAIAEPQSLRAASEWSGSPTRSATEVRASPDSELSGSLELMPVEPDIVPGLELTPPERAADHYRKLYRQQCAEAFLHSLLESGCHQLHFRGCSSFCVNRDRKNHEHLQLS